MSAPPCLSCCAAALKARTACCTQRAAGARCMHVLRSALCRRARERGVRCEARRWGRTGGDVLGGPQAVAAAAEAPQAVRLYHCNFGAAPGASRRAPPGSRLRASAPCMQRAPTPIAARVAARGSLCCTRIASLTRPGRAFGRSVGGRAGADRRRAARRLLLHGRVQPAPLRPGRLPAAAADAVRARDRRARAGGPAPRQAQPARVRVRGAQAAAPARAARRGAAAYLRRRVRAGRADTVVLARE
jgi:hypothetical protein